MLVGTDGYLPPMGSVSEISAVHAHTGTGNGRAAKNSISRHWLHQADSQHQRNQFSGQGANTIDGAKCFLLLPG